MLTVAGLIAGLECQNESEQQQVLRYLKTLWDCVIIRNASMIVQGHWRQKHFDRNSVPDVLGQGWLLI